MSLPTTIKFRGQLYRRVAESDYTQIGQIRVKRPSKTPITEETKLELNQLHEQIYQELDSLGDVLMAFNDSFTDVGEKVAFERYAEALRAVREMQLSVMDKTDGFWVRLGRVKDIIDQLMAKKAALV